MSEQIPPRKVLIETRSGEPVFFAQSINQIFAWRGLGKTNLGLGLARAFACGEVFLNWRATERHRVLYIEGEVPASQMQERWRKIVGTTDGCARLATLDKQPGNQFASMATENGMQRVEAALAQLEAEGFKTEVLMLDNISTLFNIRANDEESWIVIQSWFTSLRSRGICVFFFHHAGKSGLSRSHSKSEDMLDTSIKLEAPKDPEQGHLHAVMAYDKARAGLSEPSCEILLHRTHSADCSCKTATAARWCGGDGVSWEYRLSKTKREVASDLFGDGMSVAKAAVELGVPLGTVKMWRTEWGRDNRSDGDLDRDLLM